MACTIYTYILKKNVVTVIPLPNMIGRYEGKCMLSYFFPVFVFRFNTTQLEKITSEQITVISPLL